jgi:hypothetical protein
VEEWLNVVVLLEYIVIRGQIDGIESAVIDFDGLVVAGAFDILRDEYTGGRSSRRNIIHGFPAGHRPSIRRENGGHGAVAAPKVKILGAGRDLLKFDIIHAHKSGRSRAGTENHKMSLDGLAGSRPFNGKEAPIRVRNEINMDLLPGLPGQSFATPS